MAKHRGRCGTKLANQIFWLGKKVLITGHTGFKGSWLSLLLQRLGAEICGFSLGIVSQPSLFIEAAVSSSARSHYGDMCDFDSVLTVMQQEKPEIVFHLAAQPLVLRSYRDPVKTFNTNVMGTVHVLEAAKNTDSVRAVVIVTSDKCYENREQIWGYREEDRMGGFDPYSCSKGCAELVVASYQKSFFSKGPCFTASGRAGNVIGGGDWAEDRLIPDFIRAFMQKEKLQIRSPLAVRPWQHVLEPLMGYVLLAEHLFFGESQFTGGWNFGPPDSHVWTVERIANETCRWWGEDVAWQRKEKPSPNETQLLCLDSTKARRRLLWTSLLSMEETLHMTLDWYRQWYRGSDARKLTLEQIEGYLQRKNKIEVGE